MEIGLSSQKSLRWIPILVATYYISKNRLADRCCLLCKPSKHLLVLKTSWRRLQNMSWKRLENVFSVTIFRLPRRLEDVLKDVSKTSWKRLGRWKIVTLKTPSRRLQDMSSRRLQDVYWECLLGISVSKKSKSLSDRSISHISISDKLRRIQNALISTQ